MGESGECHWGAVVEIGIFAKTFSRPDLESVLDTVQEHGLRWIQFNLSSAGLPTLPDNLDDSTTTRIREALHNRGLHMAAISGTFNMAHPDEAERQNGLARLRVLARHCADMGTRLITLCTGSRDPNNMWRRHPDNDSIQAWADMRDCVEQAVVIAEAHEVTLGIEPEVSNIVDTARKARRLLDEIASPHLKVVMDGANLFHSGQLPHMQQVLDDAFDLLRSDIVLAHAKDLSRDGEAGHEAAGTGLLDYDRYLSLLRQAAYDGPLILHSLSETQVAASVGFLRDKLAQFQ